MSGGNKRFRPGEDALLEGMRRTCMFSHLSERDLWRVAQLMEPVPFQPGDRLGAAESEPTQALYVVTKGRVVRRRHGRLVDESGFGMGDLEKPYGGRKKPRAQPNDGLASMNDEEEEEEEAAPVEIPDRRGSPASGVIETVGTGQKLSAFGTLHALGEEPAFATTSAATDGLAWRLSSADLRRIFQEPTVARGIAGGLAAEIFRMSEQYRTPLLEQPPQVVNVAAVSVAASFEAYYRSALNSLMNASLTGQRGAMFPNMHVQIPTRVLYINGFKATRQWLTNEVDARTQHQADDGDSRSYLLLVPALLPGVLMTPISGVLEASNAGHSNPEPLYRRAFRGFVPRCLREVIFGVGLNQLSDYCEERVPESFATSKVLRNAVGSLVAGLFAGYLSHVPHNLSTMKLLQPQVRAYAVS